jgi:hypothetical protein
LLVSVTTFFKALNVIYNYSHLLSDELSSFIIATGNSQIRTPEVNAANNLMFQYFQGRNTFPVAFSLVDSK